MSVPLTIDAAASAMRRGAVSSTEIVEHAIARADALDEANGVYLARDPDQALAAAAAADARRRAGRPLGPLDGIPVGVKDIVADQGLPTTAQSLVLDARWSADAGTAPVVARLRSAGAVIMGKVTTMEFATGLPDATKPFPVPRNAWDRERWAGGSSSGSASGIALGMFLGAVGTDTAGSIRIPSAFNGVTGLKPTFGRVPKTGVVPLGYTLDHVGPMARTAADCSILLAVMEGQDAGDPYSRGSRGDDDVRLAAGDLSGLTIGVDRLDDRASAGIDPEQPAAFDAALYHLRSAGATVREVALPLYEEAVAVDLVVMLCEAHAYHARDLRARWDDYGRATRVLLASADVLSGADYVQAQRVRRLLRDRVRSLFERVDLVVTPTGHLGAPLLSDLDPGNSLTALPSVHTPYWNPVGNPTIAVPIGLSSQGTPLSLSISGRWWQDSLVLHAADALQRGAGQPPLPVPSAGEVAA